MGCCQGKEPPPAATKTVQKKENSRDASMAGSVNVDKKTNSKVESRPLPLSPRKSSAPFDGAQVPSGMSRNGYDRVCTWLMGIRGPQGDAMKWMECQQLTPEPPIEELEVISLGEQTAPPRHDDPFLRRCLKEYDTLRLVSPSTNETLIAIQNLIVSTALRADAPVEWLKRVILAYIGQDITAFDSCTAVINLLESGKYNEDDVFRTQRQVGLIKDIWEYEEARQILKQALSEISSKVGVPSTPNGGSMHSSHLSPSHSRSQSKPRAETTLIVGHSIGDFTSGTTWERRALYTRQKTWQAYDSFDPSAGPTVDDVGYEIQGKTGGKTIPAARVRLSETSVVTVLSGIAAEKLKIPIVDGDLNGHLVMRPEEVTLSVGGQETVYRYTEANLRPAGRNDLMLDELMLGMPENSPHDRCTVVAMYRALRALQRGSVEAVMGSGWGDYPSGKKVTNVTTLTRALTHEVQEPCDTDDYDVLVSLKQDWYLRSPSILKRLCSTLHVDVPQSVKLPEPLTRSRSNLSVLAWQSSVKNKRTSEVDESPSLSVSRGLFDASGTWQTGGNAVSYKGN